MSNSPVAEIVTFRLVTGTNPEAFAKAAQDMMPFLHGTGSMTGRVLSCDPDGTWTDHITWTSLEAAKTAARHLSSLPSSLAASQMFERPEAGHFMQMIDPEAMSMRHAPILMQTQLE